MIKIAPSILSADFSNLGRDVTKVKEAEWIHVDVMDGHFVPNITIGPFIVKALRKITDKFLDVHLMIENPEKYVESFAEAGADLITVHAEACKNLEGLIELIRKNNCKAGVSIKPKTGVKDIESVLDKVDLVIVMTVEPGFGGQKFMPEVVPKIRELKSLVNKRNLPLEIEVDGGVNRDNCSEIAEAGADVLVAGSAIFGSENPANELREIRERADKALNKNSK
ncbi:MAG: ribulose-phosphate 3-epimerase [Candidatus Aenigmarchaeota archaeon]|nr:ribulose-phosphate 3-epimerase [Candidatus Aenigmarchaeota archaeon]